MNLVLPILLSVCVQGDDKLRELEAIREKMAADIKESESLLKDKKAYYKSIEETIKEFKGREPKKSGDSLDEVRALRKEVAELRGMLKELMAARAAQDEFSHAMKLAPAEKPAAKVDDEGRLTLKLADAEGVNEILVYVPGRDEPLRFVLKKESKEKKENRSPKKEKPNKVKPIDESEPPACEECPFEGKCPLDPGAQAGVWY